MVELKSFEDFKQKSSALSNFWLFIYKADSEKSICAYDSLKNAAENKKDTNVFYADVNRVKDIHQHYNVETVPVLLRFENMQFKGVYKGCNDVTYYNSLFEDTMFSASGIHTETKQKSVTVYSTTILFLV